MDQLEVSKKHTETPTPKTPKATSPTFEQLLQGDASWQHNTSPTLARNHDHEEDLSPHNNKKSVLAKVKEKARKLRQSLSAKKRHDNHENRENHDGNTTPSWGVSLDDDDDDEEEDAEYLGAPMYESELAPEVYKETARQHPRADPVVPENHLLPTSNVKHEDDENNKDDGTVSKTITETVSEKLAPAYAAVTDATHTIASKIAGLTISTPQDQEKHMNLNGAPHNVETSGNNLEIRQHGGDNWSPPKWDKGVSVKEYFMNKLEPGEDDKALSQAISEAISPRRSPLETSMVEATSPRKRPHEMSMVEKVREAVTSFLRYEEHPQSTQTIKATNSLPNVPLSTKTEVAVEEPYKETTKATSFSSHINPVSPETVVSPPNSMSSVKVNRSPVAVSPRATSRQEPFKETVKPVDFSSNSNSSTSLYTTSHVPISPRKKERAKAANFSSNVPLFIKTEVPPLNSLSSTNASPLSPISSPRSAGYRGKPTKETMKAEYLMSQNPLWIRTEVPPQNSTSSANVNQPARFPLYRNTSIANPQVHVFHSASSSPLVTQEDLEEQSHGRILQAN